MANVAQVTEGNPTRYRNINAFEFEYLGLPVERGQDAVNELVWATLKARSGYTTIYDSLIIEGLAVSPEAIKVAALSSPFLHEELILDICRRHYMRNFDSSSYLSDLDILIKNPSFNGKLLGRIMRSLILCESHFALVAFEELCRRKLIKTEWAMEAYCHVEPFVLVREFRDSFKYQNEDRECLLISLGDVFVKIVAEDYPDMPEGWVKLMLESFKGRALSA